MNLFDYEFDNVDFIIIGLGLAAYFAHLIWSMLMKERERANDKNHTPPVLMSRNEEEESPKL